uniref:Alpha box protein n=1 Tax=Ajellomyces capsulatus TaxID=5037 RepID=A4URR4_AJECA|nr:alpha box protein [Histoplasma capsulatum]
MAGNDVSAVHRAFNKLFTTLTPDQVQNFQHFLHEATASTTNPTGNAAGIPSMGHGPTNIQKTNSLTDMATPILAPAASNAVSRIPPSRAKRVRENGKLRPLNSFIAFRSFYSTAFPDLSQKIKSGLLRLLWTSDPFKAKWAILAKAYSIIRDSHAGQVNLESFLELNGPLIGIVAPSDYLRVMGLKLAVSMDKQFSVIKTNHHVGPTQGDLTTNLSVDDIVTHCYQTGYVVGVLTPRNNNHGVGVAMAVTAQPNLGHYPQSSNLCQQNTASSPRPRTAHNGSPKLATANPNLVIDTETGSAESLAISSSGIGSEPNGDAALNVNSIMHLQGNFECVNPTPYTAEDFDQELRTAMNEFPIAPDDNGYFTLFNPELRNPVYIYNPYRVQSDFDPYDIGQYIDM